MHLVHRAHTDAAPRFVIDLENSDTDSTIIHALHERLPLHGNGEYHEGGA